MKVRNGFVSNSSSSSFIVELEKPIEEYSLEEFRKLITGYYNYKDPVEVLYNDLKNTESSKRKIEKWEREYYDMKQLKEKEYIVQYADDDGEFYSNMEHEFMPYLNITKRRISHH